MMNLSCQCGRRIYDRDVSPHRAEPRQWGRIWSQKAGREKVARWPQSHERKSTGLIPVTAHKLLPHGFVKDTERLQAASLQSAEYLKCRHTHTERGRRGKDKNVANPHSEQEHGSDHFLSPSLHLAPFSLPCLHHCSSNTQDQVQSVLLRPS